MSETPTVPVHAASRREDPSPRADPYAWILVIVPLLYPLLTFVAPSLYSSSVVIIIIIAINVGLATIDHRMLEKRGIDVPVWWGFIIPIYLIVRTIRAKSTPFIPVLWFVVFLVSLVLQLLGLGAVTLNGDLVNRQVAHDIKTTYGDTVRIDCPSRMTMRIHSTYVCKAVDQGQRFRVVITSTSSDGVYSWQVLR